MAIRLKFTLEAKDQLNVLQSNPAKLKRVNRCIGLIQQDPKYPGLNSHKYCVMKGKNNEDVWESYIENKAPAAWRVFWHYGPNADEITIIAITPHP